PTAIHTLSLHDALPIYIARWGLNKNEHPVSVYSSGGIYGISPAECSQETPNTQTSTFTYDDGKILEFETRGRYTNGESSLGIQRSEEHTSELQSRENLV